MTHLKYLLGIIILCWWIGIFVCCQGIFVCCQGFLRCFRDLMRVPRIRENYQGKYLNGYCNQYNEMVIMDALLCITQKTRWHSNTSNYMKFSRNFFESLQVHTKYLRFSLIKTVVVERFYLLAVILHHICGSLKNILNCNCKGWLFYIYTTKFHQFIH